MEISSEKLTASIPEPLKAIRIVKVGRRERTLASLNFKGITGTIEKIPFFQYIRHGPVIGSQSVQEFRPVFPVHEGLWLLRLALQAPALRAPALRAPPPDLRFGLALRFPQEGEDSRACFQEPPFWR